MEIRLFSLMKTIFRLFTVAAAALILGLTGCSQLTSLTGMTGASGNNPLPFPVTIGGQAAKRVTPWSYSAKVDQSVSRTAKIKASDTNGERVITNVFPSSADGTQLSNTACAIYLGNNISLADPFKGSIPKSGYYLANVVVPSKGTSRVVFQVK